MAYQVRSRTKTTQHCTSQLVQRTLHYNYVRLSNKMRYDGHKTKWNIEDPLPLPENPFRTMTYAENLLGGGVRNWQRPQDIGIIGAKRWRLTFNTDCSTTGRIRSLKCNPLMMLHHNMDEISDSRRKHSQLNIARKKNIDAKWLKTRPLV